MRTLKEICEAVHKGFEIGLDMTDRTLAQHVQDLADSTGQILSMIQVQKYLHDTSQDLRRDNENLARIYRECNAALQDKTALMFEFYQRMHAAEAELAKLKA